MQQHQQRRTGRGRRGWHVGTGDGGDSMHQGLPHARACPWLGTLWSARARRAHKGGHRAPLLPPPQPQLRARGMGSGIDGLDRGRPGDGPGGHGGGDISYNGGSALSNIRPVAALEAPAQVDWAAMVASCTRMGLRYPVQHQRPPAQHWDLARWLHQLWQWQQHPDRAPTLPVATT
jgi:hypothetical protein